MWKICFIVITFLTVTLNLLLILKTYLDHSGKKKNCSSNQIFSLTVYPPDFDPPVMNWKPPISRVNQASVLLDLPCLSHHHQRGLGQTKGWIHSLCCSLCIVKKIRSLWFQAGSKPSASIQLMSIYLRHMNIIEGLLTVAGESSSFAIFEDMLYNYLLCEKQAAGRRALTVFFKYWVQNQHSQQGNSFHFLFQGGSHISIYPCWVDISKSQNQFGIISITDNPLNLHQ